MDDFVAAVVDAVEQDRPEVRVPRAMAPLAALTNTPRKVGRLVFKRAPAKELRTAARHRGQRSSASRSSHRRSSHRRHRRELERRSRRRRRPA